MATNREKREERRMSMGERTRKAAEASQFNATTFNLPKGVEMFEPKIGQKYVVDIIPFVAGKGNPRSEAGELWWERSFWIHKGIGPQKLWAVCPARTAGQKCPICEYAEKLKASASADKKLLDSLKPKKRQLFNVVANGEKKIRLWEMSYHLFGKKLDDDILNSDPEDEIQNFAELDGGSSLKIHVTEGSTDTSKFPEVSSILYRRRPKALPEFLAEKATVLDDILIIPDYKKLKKLFFEAIDEDSDGDDDGGFESVDKDDKPAKSSKAKKDDDGDDWDEPEDKPAKKKFKPVEEEPADDEPADKPVKKKAKPAADDEDDAPEDKSAKKKAKPADDDDWDDEPADKEDKPVKKKSKPADDDGWDD